MTVAWDLDVTRPEFPTLDHDLTVDVCVVGLGGSGLTAINEALTRGMSVVGIDSDRIAAGAAGRNGGFMLAGIATFHHDAIAQHGHDRARSLYQHTLDEMEKVEQVTPGVFRRTGVLRKAHDDAEFQDCLVHLEALKADGFTGEEFSGAQGRGILITTDGVFHPARRAVMLAELAAGAGAQLFTHTPAITIESGAVHTPHGTVTAKLIIVAVDGNLSRVLPEAAPHVRAVRLQMVSTKPEAQKLEYPVYARFGYDYWQQLPDGRVTIGGGRDVAGDSEWTESQEPTDVVYDYLASTLKALGITADVENHWAATVSYTDTGLPFVQEVQPGVWGIGGYCGTGNIVGALLGRGIVEHFATGSNAALRDFIGS